jgi:opacity protein-like surface antigen
MIKKIAIVLLSTVLSSSLYADNYNSSSKGFLGFEVAAATVEGERLNDFNHEGSGVEFGLRFGAQSDEWRATFAFDYFDSSSDDQNVEKGMLMMDYFFLQTNTDMNIRPFIGANVGLINYESTGVDATDFIYGGQAGVVIGLYENIDLDISYRYSLSGSARVNQVGGIVFGLNYVY